nr:DotU/TssL family secretion system protein [Pandoraea terrae]
MPSVSTPRDTSLVPVALRDTALTVMGLAHDATPAHFDTFREKCKAQIDRLRTELESAGHPPDIVEDATYAQCALLDEAALRFLKGSDRDAWEHQPLQVTEFKSHDAGEELITRIKRRLAQPQPVLPLLAIFAAVLDLGFEGQFALDGSNARVALMAALDERLASERDTSGPVIVRSGAARGRLGKLSPLAWVLAACVTSAVAYLTLDQWLTAAIARMAS